MHAGGGPRRACARGTLVVGERHREGMRCARDAPTGGAQVCATCGCSDDLDAQSKVELIKAASNRLRGDISAELNGPDAAFSDASMQLLKFHGSYQQEDRDRRKEARRLGLAKHHQMMIRTRVP